MQLKVVCNMGSPAADCANFGICDVVIMTASDWEQFVPAHFRQVKALLSFNEQGELEFYFIKSGMLPLTELIFFQSLSFKVDAPLTLKPSVCDQLGIAEGGQVLAGMYPISSNFEYFEVCIACDVKFLYPILKKDLLLTSSKMAE
jgi:hypothetical protein